MQNDISSLIGPWKHYELSADGREMTLVGEKSQVRFIGVVCINLWPASRQEQTDDDKEIDEVISYRLRDHRVLHAPSIANPQGTSVEIGPPHLRVYLYAHWDTVRHLLGFHVRADYFSVTLICRDCEVIPLSSPFPQRAN